MISRAPAYGPQGGGSRTFEKWESRVYPRADARVIHAHAFKWWQSQGFGLSEMGPGQFVGSSASRYGLQREATVTVRDLGEQTLVELRMRAHITDEGVIAGGLALVLLWPVAVVGGAVSYARYEEDAIDLMSTFWRALEGAASIKPVDRKEQVLHTTAAPSEEVARAQSPPAAEPLTREQKLGMLEDRLARGEITEATYKEIKARL
jgi:hypothetical protein